MASTRDGTRNGPKQVGVTNTDGAAANEAYTARAALPLPESAEDPEIVAWQMELQQLDSFSTGIASTGVNQGALP